ncbi:MAG: peptidylprolyl isomerase [marine benthic group bacterium]|nr:peptidylprolyl isomerase [Gemmatimonadota bacterium]MCL7964521.1 peptidylprolyl isomerase [Gemmatimonadota bacterium]MCL7973463.1 peptidylprolyl isomerase [Gemmatimonadota bacterium]
MRLKRTTTALPSLLAVLLVAGCSAAEDALTAHSRPAATAVGHSLSTGELGRMMAESPIPDSALDSEVASQVAQLWADYVTLATIYRHPDSTQSVDYTPLLDEGRYFAALAVQRFRDSILSLNSEPTEAEVREYFDTRQPFTRLDLRRIALEVPLDAREATRDSLFAEASALRERLAGGADFVEAARAHSDEAPEQRGRVLAYQGHESVPPVADSALFAMRPGEISPVFATADAMVIYRVEQRREPEFEAARDMTYERMVEERAQASQIRTLDSLLAAGQRSIPEDAPSAAISIASRSDMAEGTISGSAPLALFVDGSLSANDLRTLFRVRPDLRQRFATATEDEAYDFLMELAADEVLVRAAEQGGFGAGETERSQLEEALAAQMSSIGGRYNLSHGMVTDPGFDMDLASESFVRAVLAAQRPVPWLSEYRYVLGDFPSRIDDQGAETAARLARDLRELETPSAAGAQIEDEDVEPEHESDAAAENSGEHGE